MTKAIPVGEPRKRPARACLACRKAKAACVVKEAGEGNEDCCVRCRRNELSCEWVALRKIGRPRRLLRIDSGEVQVNPTLLAKIKRRSTSPLSPPSLGSPGLYDLPRSPLATEVGHTRSLAESTQIASVYAQSIHHFLPLLPSNPTALVSYLRSAPSHLLLAITSLGQGVEVQVPDLVPCLYGIQTSLILVHAFYGQGHVGPAKGLMKWATEAILKLQYQHLDEGNSQLEMSGEERELVRRLWWETWCAEVMLHVVTSSRQFMLQGIPFQVDLPSDSRSPSMSALGLRIRALSLLVIASETPTGTAVPVTRLEALERIGQNLAFLASQHSTSLNPTSTIEAAEKEATLMAGLISSAAIIYLHSASYAASAFVCGFDSVQQLPSTALRPIRKAGEHIFNLIRSSRSVGSTHSPFFGCSILVASQGMILSLEEEAWAKSSVASDLELGQEVLKQHAERWKGSAMILNEVKRLRFSIDHGEMSDADLVLPDSFVIS